MDRPAQRLGNQRRMCCCCCGSGEDDESNSEGRLLRRSWLRGSMRKTMPAREGPPIDGDGEGEGEGEGEASWWQKGWNSVRRAGEWSENLIEEAGTLSGPKWRLFLKKLKNEGRTIYPRKPVRFQYDAFSYAQNFDEGCWHESEHPYHGFSARFAAKPREI